MENCPYAAICREHTQLQFWLVGNVLLGHGQCSFLCEKMMNSSIYALQSFCGQTFANNSVFFCILFTVQYNSYCLLALIAIVSVHSIYEYCKVNKSQLKPVLMHMHKIRGNQVGVPRLIILIDGFNCCLMRLEYG